MTEADGWPSYLAFLLAGAGRDLEGGAELEVSDPDGEWCSSPRWPVISGSIETGTLWVRPVVGGYRPEPGQGMPPYAGRSRSPAV